MATEAIKKATLDRVIREVETNKYAVVSTYLLSDKGISTLKSRYLVAHTGKYLNSSGKMLLVCKQ